MRGYSRHFENWVALVDQVGLAIQESTSGLDLDEYVRRVDQALTDLGEPIDWHDYERLYGSRYDD